MKTVYAYVVADILHPGHTRHLRAARQLGDHLIVGILSTRAAMEKKPRPIMSFTHRMELIRALQCVDSVQEQYEYSPLENVKRLRPDILAESEDHKGNDYLAELLAYAKVVGMKVVFLSYTRGISSSRYKDVIIRAAKKNKHA